MTFHSKVLIACFVFWGCSQPKEPPQKTPAPQPIQPTSIVASAPATPPPTSVSIPASAPTSVAASVPIQPTNKAPNPIEPTAQKEPTSAPKPVDVVEGSSANDLLKMLGPADNQVQGAAMGGKKQP